MHFRLDCCPSNVKFSEGGCPSTIEERRFLLQIKNPRDFYFPSKKNYPRSYRWFIHNYPFCKVVNTFIITLQLSKLPESFILKHLFRMPSLISAEERITCVRCASTIVLTIAIPWQAHSHNFDLTGQWITDRQRVKKRPQGLQLFNYQGWNFFPGKIWEFSKFPFDRR